MKKILIICFSCLFILTGTCFGEATEEKPLNCPRKTEITKKVTEVSKNACQSYNFIKKHIDPVFKFEVKFFNENIINKILKNNAQSPSYLTEYGIYELKKHNLCLKSICQKIWEQCNANKNYVINSKEIRWCENIANNQFVISKLKLETAIKSNNNRKTNSSLREKLRAIEERINTYLVPNLMKFAQEFVNFTCKITSFVRHPLSQ